MRWCCAVIRLLLLLSGPAWGQVTFGDRFDTPNLLQTSGGVWEYAFGTGPGVTLTVALDGGRRGGSDGRLVMRDVSSGVGGTAQGQMGLGTSFAGTGTQYFRYWFRQGAVATSVVGDDMSLGMVQSTSTIGTACEPTYFADTRQLGLSAFDRNSNYLSPAGRATADGGWQLLEALTVGLGGTGGTCSMWVDGALVARQQNIDWSGLTFRSMIIGQAFGQDGFQGVLEFDEFAAAPAPLAARLTLSVAGSQLFAGDCVQVTVGLRNSVDGGSANAIGTATVTVSSTGNAAFFNGAACSAPATAQNFVSSASYSLRLLAPGPVVLTATGDNYLPAGGNYLISVPPDAGPQADAGTGDAGAGDAGPVDGGAFDAGSVDGGPAFDGGIADGGDSDGGAGGGGGTAGGSEAGGGEAGGAVEPQLPRELALGCACSGAEGLWLLPVSMWLRRRRCAPRG